MGTDGVSANQIYSQNLVFHRSQFEKKKNPVKELSFNTQQYITVTTHLHLVAYTTISE
jgi:PHD/YefM family antitoxin component YafN of YafNO toxin-antitoxin module